MQITHCYVTLCLSFILFYLFFFVILLLSFLFVFVFSSKGQEKIQKQTISKEPECKKKKENMLKYDLNITTMHF